MDKGKKKSKKFSDFNIKFYDNITYEDKGTTSKKNRGDLVFDICEKFLQGHCMNQKCNSIHNYSIKNKKANNLEFAEQYTQLSHDLHLLIEYEKQLHNSTTTTVQSNEKVFFIFNTDEDEYSLTLSKDILECITRHFTRDTNKKGSDVETKMYSISEVSKDNDCIETFQYAFYTSNIAFVKKFMAQAKSFGYKVEFDDVISINISVNINMDSGDKLYCIKVIDYSRIYDFIISIFQELSKIPKGKEASIFLFASRPATISTGNLTMSTMRGIQSTLASISLAEDTTFLDTKRLSSQMEELITRIFKDVKQEDHQPLQKEYEESSLNIDKENEYNCMEKKFTSLSFENFWEQSKSYPEYKCICHSWFIKMDRNVNFSWKDPLIQTSRISSTVKISKLPFSKGSMRYAFYMYDTYLNQRLVGKIPLNMSHLAIDLSSFVDDIKTITYCRLISEMFNERIIKFKYDSSPLIKFVDTYVYEIQDDDYTLPAKFYSVENFIQGFYEKYNNNSGWINNDNKNAEFLITQTFSHFSWQLTRGYLMIVDLQGVGTFLTDPQIHCLEVNKFGKGNLGYFGMLKFFSTHECNSYCELLGLIHPSQNAPIDVAQFDFFVVDYKKPKNISNNDSFFTLCDLCKVPYAYKGKDFYEKKLIFAEIYCDRCEKLRRGSMKTKKCHDCNIDFSSSEYWFKMKRADFPIRCSKCRLDNRIKLRSGISMQSKSEA